MIEARFRVDRGSFALDVDLRLPSNGVTAVFGPSGSGKTTFLRLLAGLEQSPVGFLRVGDDVWQDSQNFLPTHRRSIGYVFQEASLFPHLSVRRNLEYGLRRVPDHARRVSLDETVDLLGIRNLLNRVADELSGGERQRVAIARALAVSPGLLLMDEPLASLDKALKQEILHFLESLHRNLDIPVIYVSHSFEEVARLADHLVVLDAGTVTASGPIVDVLTRLDLPLAHLSDAETVFDAAVAAHDETYGLTHVDFDGGRITFSGTDLAIGSHVRLRIAARDVSLTLEKQSRTSILNILSARVEELVPRDSSRVTVRLMVGGVPLLARITRKSAEVLELQPGSNVYAQVKSVAVLA